MESWEGHNYYTRNTTKWVELMNLSTTEWSVGFLPSNLIALPTSLPESTTLTYPPGTLIIENASQTDLGSRSAEAVVFGLCSGIALLWAAIWLVVSKRNGSLNQPLAFSPSQSSTTHSRGSHPSSLTAVNSPSRTSPFHERDFEALLLNKYYPNYASHAEFCPDSAPSAVTAKAASELSDLLMKIFLADSRLLGWHKNSKSVANREEMDRLRADSDAMLAEVQRRVDEWRVEGLGEEERREVEGVVRLLEKWRGGRYMGVVRREEVLTV